jgi:hypothetical protein
MCSLEMRVSRTQCPALWGTIDMPGNVLAASRAWNVTHFENRHGQAIVTIAHSCFSSSAIYRRKEPVNT